MRAARVSDVREFRSLVSYVCDALDGDGGAATANAQHERRRLHVSQLLDGMVAIDGLLDREAGEILVTALRAAMDPPRHGRRADDGATARGRVGDVVRSGRAGLGERTRTRAPAAVSVDVDLEVLERRAGPTLVRRVRGGWRASSGGSRPRRCGASRATPASTRVVTDGASAPLDVGRTTRVVSPALWRALVVRDGGCVAPGCDRPPGWCDAHHRVHWVDGGATSLDNLELRCRRHHRAVHEGAREGGPEP